MKNNNPIQYGYRFIAISYALVIIGFLLMALPQGIAPVAGTLRICVAPIVCTVGYLLIGYGLIRKSE